MQLKKMTQLTEKNLSMIEVMAGTGFSLDEIAEVLEVDPTEFATEYRNTGSAVRKHYRKGYLQAQLELRKRIFKDAGHGSSPAQTLAKGIMDAADFKLKSYE